MTALFLFAFFTVPVFSQIHILIIQIKTKKKTQSSSESIFLRLDIILNGTVLYTQSCKIMLDCCNVPQYPTDPLEIKNPYNDHQSVLISISNPESMGTE
jgi:hypothetical protein